MRKDILVTILEEDVFARNWMALLLVRDWRTRLVHECANWVDFWHFIAKSDQMFDFLVLDVDFFGKTVSIKEIGQSLIDAGRNPKILLTGIKPDPDIIRQISTDQICGYVLKHQVDYSLSWVISFAQDGYFLLTQGTRSLANDMNLILPDNKLVVDGRRTRHCFTEHEAKVARMAFIFSLGRRDLADELQISQQWSYGLVSELYKKMGLNEVLSGEVDLFSYIGKSQVIRSHFEKIMEQLGPSKKARDLETLAYHMLTMPQIVE
jgi:hypothetical protein